MNHTTQQKNILTASKVSAALRKGEPDTLKDGGSLSLIVTGKGEGKWLFRGRKKGSRTLIDLTCGYARLPETGLKEARDRREEFRLLLKQGINPNEQRRAEREAEKLRQEQLAKTFAVVAQEYLSTRRDITPKTMQTYAGRLNNHINPFMGSLPIDSLNRRDHLKPVIDKLVARQAFTQARHVAHLVESVCAYALDAGYIEASPADHLTRLVPKQAVSEKKHHAAATTPEGAALMLGKLWDYLNARQCGPYMAAALKLTAYLPLRNSNIVTAKWEDVDLDAGRWTFTATKNGKSYMLPLSRQVREVLTDLRNYKRNGWLFPSGGKLGHLTNEGMLKTLRTAGISQEEQSLHGFRATFESLALAVGMPKVLCEQALFHVAGDATEQAYNRTDYTSALLPLLQWWADAVDSLRAGGELPPVPEELKELYR